MAHFKIELANRILEINSLHEDIVSLCNDYRIGEKTSDAQLAECDLRPIDIRVSTTQADIEFERQKSYEEDDRNGVPRYEYPDGYLETLAIYRQIATAMLDYDTMLFHGSALAIDGEAYVFTALSGTGKSTHRRLWQSEFGDRVTVINDDKPLLRVCAGDSSAYSGELASDAARAFVCGTPWDGKHRVSTNTQVPIKAICILERGEENEIQEISVAEAIPNLLIQSYRPSDPALMLKTLSVLDKIAKNVKFYRLKCNMDPSAAHVAYEGMK